MAPLMTAQTFNKDWKSNTANLSSEEMADMLQAKLTLENYEKIYDIFDYCTKVSKLANMVETRVCSNNPSLPMNMYRISKSSAIEEIFPEIEKVLVAYYSLIDDMADYPDWQKKIQKELGGTVSYLCLTIDESSRNLAVELSPVYARFDMEK
jgi:hypothetical protein